MNKRFIYFCVVVAVVFVVCMYVMKQVSSKIEETKAASPTFNVERTLAIIKPGAVAAGHADSIIKIIKENNFTIIRENKIMLTHDQAEHFYEVHKGKPFFEELVIMMTKGPIVVLALEKEGAIKAWRDLMGNTDPKKAEKGTIRQLFGIDKGSNATHGSDSVENAAKELAIFFPDL